ncbi:hypothetical protein BH09BAC5_BH09BAC5_13220 [soil metagenome]
MKKTLLVLCAAILPFVVFSQCSVQTNVTNVTCYNACNGTATAFPLGGTPPYTYLWNPGGQTTQTATALCAGQYTIYVTDSLGCVASAFVTITQPGQITVVSLSPQPATCSTCCDGTASAVVSGGIPPFTYTWLPASDVTASVTDLCVGPHNFCVTDSTGCTVCQLFTVANAVGIQDHNGVENLSVYPSPATDAILVDQTFANASNTELSLVNVLGEVIYVKHYNSITNVHESIDLKSFPPGIYFVRIKTNSGTSVKKFVKQ